MGMTKHEIDRKLDEIVDFAGIARYIDTPVKRFSSGMSVRLGFAIAAFLEPEILVVDEVLAVGDAEFQKKAIGKMQDVSSTGGRTVLFVSHNMAAVKSLCKKGIVLKNGQIDYIGTADECIDRYLIDNTTIVGDKMVDRVNQKAHFITVNSIKIDGNDSTNIILPSNKNTLEINIEGESQQAFTGNIKLYFRNSSGVPLAALAESTYKGDLMKFSAGTFKIQKEILLPKYMNHGTILLDLLLYNKDIHYFHADHLANLEVVGSCDLLGQPLNVAYEGLFGLETL